MHPGNPAIMPKNAGAGMERQDVCVTVRTKFRGDESWQVKLRYWAAASGAYKTGYLEAINDFLALVELILSKFVIFELLNF